MELPPELKPPLLPELSLEHIAEHERDCGHAFFENMRMLQRWSFDFSSSASLFDFAVKPPTTDVRVQWCFIAARNGGLALRNYARSWRRRESFSHKSPAGRRNSIAGIWTTSTANFAIAFLAWRSCSTGMAASVRIMRSTITQQ